MLLLVAVMSLILGMGLPTTANYIVVSSLMAPVIVRSAAKSGLIVPLIAVHLFVFYFGILADDTPPVGLAAFAAAAISGGDPIKTGLQGFATISARRLLPFLFIFNTELLLIDVGPGQGGVRVLVAVDGDDAVCGGDATLVADEKPTVGVCSATAGCFHLVQAGLLARPGIGTLCRDGTVADL